MVQSLQESYISPDFLIYVLVCTAQANKSMKTNEYTIEKPYKIATRNAKKNFEFSKICKIFSSNLLWNGSHKYCKYFELIVQKEMHFPKFKLIFG